MTDERQFPILPDWRKSKEPRESVPWRIVAPHAKQAMKNHSQSLERLAERGGLSWCELAAVMADRPYSSMQTAAARRYVLDAEGLTLGDFETGATI